ncbi:MAG: zinc ribbon domain-containing protein [Lachnospiraceae bacterium]|nr:zinc ribbon domain-containing protein [Lachnospiraceae bacterium]
MNIDDITAKMRKISMETVAEVQKLNDVRNLNAQINAQKKMVQAMYGEIGKKLYDQYKEAPLDGFESDFQALNGAFEHIEQLREEIRAAKGVTLCPNCKMEVGVDERFCSNCGSKMPEVFRIVDEEDEKKPENTAASEMPEDKPEEQASEMPEDMREERTSDAEENSEVTA